MTSVSTPDAPALPTITTFGWVPGFARGHVRDLRARWAFEETGQAYRVALVHGPAAKQPAHRALQPFGQVPTYDDGIVAIFESGAMVLRIAERAGGLLPPEEAARARAVQWLIAALNSIEPHVSQLVACDLFEADRPWSAARRPAVAADLDRRLGELAAALGDGPWLDGDAFTVGDLMMVSVLRTLGDGPELARHPSLVAYRARGEARPAFRRALADQLALYADAPAPA